MPEVCVKARDGTQHRIDAENGTALMETLRDAGLGVDGTCGGACACGTCHVYVAGDWLNRLPARSNDEAAMLDAIADFVPLREGSRLSCQIPVSDALEGLVLEVAPRVD